MTTIRTRPYPDDGAAVTGQAATMPPVTGPGRPGRASRTRLRLAVAAAGGLLAAGMIMLAAVAAAGAAADRAPRGEPALGPARPGTATTLTSGATPSTAGGVVTYAATVRRRRAAARWRSPTAPPGFPGAAPTVDNAGTATCQVAYPGAGVYAITAAYSGDARHAANPSAALAQQVAYRMQLLGDPAASGTSGPAVSVRVVLLDQRARTCPGRESRSRSPVCRPPRPRAPSRTAPSPP